MPWSPVKAEVCGWPWVSLDSPQLLCTSRAVTVPYLSDSCAKTVQLKKNWVRKVFVEFCCCSIAKGTQFMTESIWLWIFWNCLITFDFQADASLELVHHRNESLSNGIYVRDLKGMRQRHAFHSTRVLLSQKWSHNQFWWFQGYTVS